MRISVLRGVGWVPQKSAGFGATAPAEKNPRSRCGTKKTFHLALFLSQKHPTKNIPFGTIFIEFGDTKTCCTFSGLELAPKSRKKLIGALREKMPFWGLLRGKKTNWRSQVCQRSQCIQSLWDQKKFLLCKSTKKA